MDVLNRASDESFDDDAFEKNEWIFDYRLELYPAYLQVPLKRDEHFTKEKRTYFI